MKRPKILSFERKLDPSDAVLRSTVWKSRSDASSWIDLKIREKSVRGTISNDLAAGDQNPAKIDANIRNANPQTVDVATLPSHHDTLVVRFTLRALGNVGNPTACGDPEFRGKLDSVVNDYVNSLGFGEISRRYAANLANGRFLWRNRIGAEAAEVVVAHLKDGKAEAQWIFNAIQHKLFDLSAPEGEAEDVKELAKLIESGFLGAAHVLLQVTAFVRIGEGQEVFPSQELIMNRERGSKSKTLYSVGEGEKAVAAIHSQKIGNAIRTIDTWYPGANENGPIAVEPYGSVTTQGKAYRQPKDKKDFYSLLDGWVVKDKVPDTEQQHFVIATLIRGGVFGEAG